MADMQQALKQIQDGVNQMSEEMTFQTAALVCVVNALKQTGSIDMNILTANMEGLREHCEREGKPQMLARIEQFLEGCAIPAIVHGARPKPQFRVIERDTDPTNPEKPE